jgi:hypothetical protein
MYWIEFLTEHSSELNLALIKCMIYKASEAAKMNEMEPDWCNRAAPTHLVAMDTHVVASDESLEDNHPAGVGGSLKQSVRHLGDVHVGGVGGTHQICSTKR